VTAILNAGGGCCNAVRILPRWPRLTGEVCQGRSWLISFCLVGRWIHQAWFFKAFAIRSPEYRERTIPSVGKVWLKRSRCLCRPLLRRCVIRSRCGTVCGPVVGSRSFHRRTPLRPDLGLFTSLSRKNNLVPSRRNSSISSIPCLFLSTTGCCAFPSRAELARSPGRLLTPTNRTTHRCSPPCSLTRSLSTSVISTPAAGSRPMTSFSVSGTRSGHLRA